MPTQCKISDNLKTACRVGGEIVRIGQTHQKACTIVNQVGREGSASGGLRWARVRWGWGQGWIAGGDWRGMRMVWAKERNSLQVENVSNVRF